MIEPNLIQSLLITCFVHSYPLTFSDYLFIGLWNLLRKFIIISATDYRPHLLNTMAMLYCIHKLKEIHLN